jgi:hypothetical protein
LINTEAKRAKSKEKEFNLNDGDGLALRVKPNGSKLWIFTYYRSYTRIRTSLSFGTYPTITLAEARNRRKSALALLSQDTDPKELLDEMIECTRLLTATYLNISQPSGWKLKVKNQRYQKTMPLIPGAL